MHTHSTKQPGYRILVVDDNEAAALALSTLLQYRGHTVRTASSGSEAITKVTEEEPELLFLDIGLPDKTGYEVAKELRMVGVRAKMIALSGYGQERDKLQAIEAGMNAHLTKPAELSQIEDTIASVMSKDAREEDS